jgi:2-polyprenyl-6-methoxyphenol hydroxylase-like FAD-dependent oxidoreductase
MTFHKHQPTYDVIISGAGPVGLFLACELALAKCSVLILEKAENPHSPLKQLPFGIRGLSALSVEALYRRGLLEELEVPKRLKDPHSNAVQGPRRQVGHFAGIPFHSGNIDISQWKYRLPSSTDTSLISEMQELETVLARRAEALGVEIKRGLSITDFHQTDDQVTVASGDQCFQGKWLVGCDGSRSVVQPGFLVMQDFDGGAFHSAEKTITLERVQEVLRRISNTDVAISALHIATTWTDRARQATAYRNGRVLLAGDAAHIHAPLGGQGLNLGLGDAMNLGWKLAATIQEKAAEGLLDSYHTERYPLGAQVLEWSRAQVLAMRPDPNARALNAILRDLMDTRDGATYFAGRVWGVTTRYDLGGDHPLVGYSVPNFEFEDGTTIGELLREARGVLLDFNRNASLETFASEYRDRIKFVSGRAEEQLGLSTVLIRPDGFIAWASDNEPDEQSIRRAVALWFGSRATKGTQ